MIKLNRLAAPAALTAAKIQDTLNNLREKFNNGEKIATKDFPSHWSEKSIKDALFEIHNGKCCFCERARDKAREPDVEHFRPKAKVTEDATHPGYWWLAFDWDNFLWACKACNEEYKRNHFPLSDPSTRVRVEGGDLSGEESLLLNPAQDNCEQFFRYDWISAPGLMVKMDAVDADPRARTTIEILGLNRQDLLEERNRHLEYILRAVAVGIIVGRDQAALEERKNESIGKLKDLISPKSQFSGLARAYFSSMHLAEYF
jgi:uncharacterized protein (TIGR02646 family)